MAAFGGPGGFVALIKSLKEEKQGEKADLRGSLLRG
jgi:hypothetical protein